MALRRVLRAGRRLAGARRAAALGEIPIRGHLPVTIPNVAQRGAGLERPAQVAETQVTS